MDGSRLGQTDRSEWTPIRINNHTAVVSSADPDQTKID